MKRFSSVLIIAAFCSFAAHGAASYTPIGAGGGGWLHAGAYHPTSPNIVAVGADVSGVYLSMDGGRSWTPHNKGLVNNDEIATHYVEDIVGVDNSYFSGFLVATYGGIYKFDLDNNWDPLTPFASYYYRHQYYDNQGNPTYTRMMAIPFSCVDVCGNIAVAGAGRVRYTNRKYENQHYPVPDYVHSTSHDGAHSVWLYDFSASNPQWFPIDSTTFGAVRDISVRVIGDTTYIAAATTEGVYLYSGSSGGTGSWLYIGELGAIVNGELRESLEYGTTLEGWSIHISSNGAVYLSCTRWQPSADFPSGVYRLRGVVGGGSGLWEYLDDLQNVPFFNRTMTAIGTSNSLHPACLSTHTLQPAQFAYLTVVDDGPGGEPDRLYLGSAINGYGLFRGIAPVDSSNCSWVPLVYNSGNCVEGVLHGAPDGWIDFWGSSVLFHPVVYPGNPDRLIVQFDARLHRSLDDGNTWSLSYTGGSELAGWRQIGYNEICVLDFGWWGNRLLEATGDCGLFLSTDNTLARYKNISPGVGTYPSGSQPADVHQVWNRECYRVHVVNDWHQTGTPAMFASFGDVIQRRVATRIMMYRAVGGGDPEWSWVGSALQDPEHYLFPDFAVAGDTTIFACYLKYADPVGTGVAPSFTSGVLTLTYSDNDWQVQDVSPTNITNIVPSAIMYHESSNRVYLAAQYNNGKHDGGIWYLHLDDSAQTWQPCVGATHDPSHATVPELQRTWCDVRCLAQSNDGTVLYAGTRGRSGAGYGTILKHVLAGDPPGIWEAQVNINDSSIYFGFDVPEHSNWPALYANRTLTWVKTICVDSADPNKYYVGLSGDYGRLMTSVGLWYYDGQSFTQLSRNEKFHGIGVSAVAIAPSGKVIVGTDGLGMWQSSPPPTPPKPDDPIITLRVTQHAPLQTGCQISLTVGTPGHVAARIYDLRGRLVKQITAFAGHPGEHILNWEGVDSQGRACASGVYLVKVKTGREEGTAKIVHVR